MDNEITGTGFNPTERYEKVLTHKMKVALIAHFVNAVPIERVHLSPAQRAIVARIDHVYWLYRKNPFLDIHAMFYELAKQYHKDGQDEGRKNAAHSARRDERLFEFVLEQVKPHNRKDSEFKVRAVTDKLMMIGMQTDNVQAMAKGADLRIKLDRLDQPESEQADMSNISFLPSVVVTDIREVDDTKEYYDDERSKAIMKKYGAHVDEKRKLIEDKVAAMEGSEDGDDS